MRQHNSNKSASEFTGAIHINDSNCVVVLGTRYDESNERNKILNNTIDNEFMFQQKGYKNTVLFCPIVKFDTDDVWEGLLRAKGTSAVNMQVISNIYKEISGECPIIRLPDSNPCSKGRFGCWTCTVIRQDKASKNLILNGYTSLKPLYDFRSWLLSIRDDINFRCSVRRNGIKGLGPFRLSARELILKRLQKAEELSGHSLIEKDEISEIQKLWVEDRNNSNYFEDQEVKSSYTIA